MSDRVRKEEVEKAIGNLHVHSITGELLRSQVVAADLLRRLLAEREALEAEILRMVKDYEMPSSVREWFRAQAKESRHPEPDRSGP